MTKREAFLVMATTGLVVMPFSDFHEMAEQEMGRPIWTHQFGNREFVDTIKAKVHDEWIELCKAPKE